MRSNMKNKLLIPNSEDAYKATKNNKSCIDINKKKSDEKFEDKCVAWFDLLGIRNDIKNKNENKEVYDIFRDLEEMVDKPKKDNVIMILVGDGVFCYTDKEHIDSLIEIAMDFQWHFLEKYTKMLRGSIVYDEIYLFDEYSNIKPIGMAYVRAFELESEVSVFPRIIVEEKCYEYINKCKEFIYEDSDKEKFLNFLKYKDVEKEDIKKVIEKINDIKNTANIDDKTKQKYNWILSLLEKELKKEGL